MASYKDFKVFTCHFCAHLFPMEYIYGSYYEHHICLDCWDRRADMLRTGNSTAGSSLHMLLMEPTQILNGDSVTYSKRPVRCPLFNCQETISVSAIHIHFQYDHPDVPRMYVDIEKVYDFMFNIQSFDEIDGHNSCLLLMHIDLQAATDGNPGSSSAVIPNSRYANISPCFIIGVLKVPRENEEKEKKDDNKDPKYNYLFYAMSHIHRHNYAYTMAIGVVNHSFDSEYAGPLASITESYEKLIKECKGVFVTAEQVQSIKNRSQCIGDIHICFIIQTRENNLALITQQIQVELAEEERQKKEAAEAEKANIPDELSKEELDKERDSSDSEYIDATDKSVDEKSEKDILATMQKEEDAENTSETEESELDTKIDIPDNDAAVAARMKSSTKDDTATTAANAYIPDEAKENDQITDDDTAATAANDNIPDDSAVAAPIDNISNNDAAIAAGTEDISVNDSVINSAENGLPDNDTAVTITKVDISDDDSAVEDDAAEDDIPYNGAAALSENITPSVTSNELDSDNRTDKVSEQDVFNINSEE